MANVSTFNFFPNRRKQQERIAVPVIGAVPEPFDIGLESLFDQFHVQAAGGLGIQAQRTMDQIEALLDSIPRYLKSSGLDPAPPVACSLADGVAAAHAAVIGDANAGQCTLLSALETARTIEVCYVGDGAVFLCDPTLRFGRIVSFDMSSLDMLSATLGANVSPTPARLLYPRAHYPDGLCVALMSDGVTDRAGLVIPAALGLLSSAANTAIESPAHINEALAEGLASESLGDDNRSLAFFATPEWVTARSPRLRPRSFIGAAKHPGPRPYDQDAAMAITLPGARLIAVADGVGTCGSPAAENAAHAAMDGLRDWFMSTFGKEDSDDLG